MKRCVPSAAKVGVAVGEGGAVLAEVAVQGRGEALEGHAEHAMQTLEDRDRQRGLRVLDVRARVGRRRQHAQSGRVPLQQHPHARNEQLELAVVEATVPVQVLLKQ